MKSIISKISLILDWWLYNLEVFSVNGAIFLLPAFLFGIYLSWKMRKKGRCITAIILALTVIACEILCTAVFHRHMGALLPAVAGGIVLAMLLGMGFFLLVRLCIRRLRKGGKNE